MFRIKITYDTGSSFGHEYGLISRIDEIVFDSVEKAEEAVQWIYEHYETKTMLGGYAHSFYEEDREKAIAVRDKAPWYDNYDYGLNREGDYYTWMNQVRLKNEDGEFVTVRAFWCGHFESLVSAEVVVMNVEERAEHRRRLSR